MFDVETTNHQRPFGAASKPPRRSGCRHDGHRDAGIVSMQIGATLGHQTLYVYIYVYIYMYVSYHMYRIIYIYIPHTTQKMPMTFKWLLIFLDRLLTRFPLAYIYMFTCAHCIWQTQVYIYTTSYTHIINIYIYNYIIYYYRWTHRETYVTLFW